VVFLQGVLPAGSGSEPLLPFWSPNGLWLQIIMVWHCRKTQQVLHSSAAGICCCCCCCCCFADVALQPPAAGLFPALLLVGCLMFFL
jgi:hypothetical protein